MFVHQCQQTLVWLRSLISHSLWHEGHWSSDDFVTKSNPIAANAKQIAEVPLFTAHAYRAPTNQILVRKQSFRSTGDHPTIDYRVIASISSWPSCGCAIDIDIISPSFFLLRTNY